MRIFRDIPGNARTCLILEPLWAVFGGMIFFYVPLYMKGLGLSEVEMGVINTVNMLVSFICHFIAGPVTNRLGRKKATLVFDVISWTIPMLIWAAAQNFWYFLVAASINAFVRIVNVSWNCLMVEDTPPSKRARVFGIIYLINYASGIFTPITGIFIARYGTVPAMRVVYLLGVVSMTSMFFIRNVFVKETKAGSELIIVHSGLSILQSMKDYLQTISGALKNKAFLMITSVFVITNLILSLNFFQVLFLKEHLGFNALTVSVTPGVNAFVNVVLYLFLIPRLGRLQEEKSLSIAAMICLAGSLLFLFIPRNSAAVMIIAVAILAAGSLMIQTYRDSLFMNRVGEHEKADMFGAVQTLTALVCIPSGYIAGLAYSISPLLPFIIISALYLLVLFIAVRLSAYQ